MNYHVDRFYAAVSVLAGDGHIKQRLTKAFQDHLDEIDPSGLPEELREAFIELRASMRRVAPLNGEGPICASVRKMSVDEASRCATSVVALFRRILPLAEDLHDLRVPPCNDEEESLPPLLVKSAS